MLVFFNSGINTLAHGIRQSLMKLEISSSRLLVRSQSLCGISQSRKVSGGFKRASLLKASRFSTSVNWNGNQSTITENAVSEKQQASGLSLRNCLVTGGASGIGYEVAKALILNGVSNVTITSRDPQKAKKAIDRIKADTDSLNAPIHFVECDFEKTISLDALKQRNSNGNLNFNTLINCAGISQSTGLLSTSLSTTSLILKTNLEAPIELSRQFLKDYFSHGKSLTKQKSPQDTPTTTTDSLPSYCIINISSLLAQRGGYGTSIYSTSKAGLIAFTRTLALEGAAIRSKFPALPPFRANVVVPGYIDTPMIETFSEQHKRKLEGEIPLGRYGSTAEVADAVLFLLRNEYANNTVLGLDGGLSAV